MKLSTCIILILFQLLTASFAWAGPKEAMERRLNLGLKIFPLIVAADKDLLSKKTKAESLLLLLVYKNERERAAELGKRLEENIKPIKKTPVEVDITGGSAEELSGSRRPSGIFLTEYLPDDEFQKVINFGIERQAIVFSPIIGDVERGAAAGIYISTSTLPSLNMTTLKKAGIRIRKKFRKISKKYE